MRMWLAVCDMYEDEMIMATTGGHRGDRGLRDIMKHSFVDINKPYVGCGCSSPKSENLIIKYRSKQDRRVEILFF